MRVTLRTQLDSQCLRNPPYRYNERVDKSSDPEALTNADDVATNEQPKRLPDRSTQGRKQHRTKQGLVQAAVAQRIDRRHIDACTWKP